MAIMAWLWAGSVLASPERYRLDGQASRIDFTVLLEDQPISGSMPIIGADVLVDFEDLGASKVSVTMQPARATTTLGFATDVMRQPSMLDTGQHPQAVFRSTNVTPIGNRARLTGDLTLRGVTRSVTLDGAIYRRRGSDPGDLSDLVLIFDGVVDRHAFGVSGFRALVDAQVGLRVLVAIVRE